MACSESAESAPGKSLVTENAASDEMPEYICQPCSDDGEKLAAAGYCIDCEEYLCVTCFTQHRKAKPCRHHTILDKSKMNSVDDCTDPCSLHKGEVLNYFCNSHNQRICQRCTTIDHRHCHVGSVEDLSEGIGESPEYNEINKQLKNIGKHYDRTQILAKKHEDEIRVYYTSAKEGLKRIRDEDLKVVNSISATCNSRITEIKTITSKLEIIHTSKRNRKLFLAMYKVKNAIQGLDETLSKLDTDNELRRYRFSPKEELNATDGSAKHLLGQLVKLPQHVSDNNVKSSTDNAGTYSITGAAVLSDHQLIIADELNKNVKVLSIKQKTIVSEMQLPSPPWDLTVVDNNQVAVTIPAMKMIHLLSIGPKSVSKVQEITVSGQCRGIVNNDGKLIVTYTNPSKVEMIDMKGTVLKTIESDANGAQLFKNPQYIAFNAVTNVMFVSDSDGGTVTSVSCDGTINAVYTDASLKCPRGLTIDKSGTVYVTGNNPHYVFQIRPDCTKFQILLGVEWGLKDLRSIAYCDKEDKLYVGMYNNIILKAFQVK